MHLGMSGSFRIEGGHGDGDEEGASAGELAPGLHDHVIFRMSAGALSSGVPSSGANRPLQRHPPLRLHGPGAAGAVGSYPALRELGPNRYLPRSTRRCWRARAREAHVAQGGAAGSARRCRARQHLRSAKRCSSRACRRGDGRRRLRTAVGAPRESAQRLTAAIKQVLTEAIERQADPARYRGARFRVYDREGEPCRRPGCDGTIVRRTQAGRSTFFCPVCQALAIGPTSETACPSTRGPRLPLAPAACRRRPWGPRGRSRGRTPRSRRSSCPSRRTSRTWSSVPGREDAAIGGAAEDQGRHGSPS